MPHIAAERIRLLRSVMEEHTLDAYIVGGADPHQTEYVHPHWNARAWLSGFTGSAGTVVVLADKAGLWTDGRYYIQAERELEGSGIDLFKAGMDEVPTVIEWLCSELSQGEAVGVDGRLITAKTGRDWAKKLDKKHLRLITDHDLITPLWQEGRPALSKNAARLYPASYAGRSCSEKLLELREAINKEGADTYLVSSLYNLAWLFNLRGNDTENTPLLTAYGLVEKEKATLFIDEEKISDAVREVLAVSGVSLAPYENVFQTVEGLSENAIVYLCENRLSFALSQRISCEVVRGDDLIEGPRARKNETELANWKQVHVLDGLAMLRFWRWLEATVPQGGVDEVSAADRLEEIRRKEAACIDLSFTTISGYGGNAAMMHYSAKRGDCAALESRGLYLVDSGGQYLGGTTDITRTFALGKLTEEQCRDYTLVLKGLIGLSTAIFLKGATGANLDVLARQPLWEQGLDYKCGTGHGVGCYLNVHEGPQNFSPSMMSKAKLEPGMVITIEPGVYRENRHGIRIENMVVVEERCVTDSGTFYGFGTMTLCPIDTAPLVAEMMSAKEINWLNAYHQTVYESLLPQLNTDEAAWLEGKTRPFAGT